MMNKLITILCFLCCTLTIDAQRIASFFVIMPDDLLPQLEVNRRKDLLDYTKAGRKEKVTNNMGGESELTQIAEDYLLLQLSEHATMQLKLLPLNEKESIIGVINTVCGTVCDSRIDFYDAKWRKIDLRQVMKLPLISDFLSANSTANERKQAKGSVDMALMQMNFNADNNNLTIQSTIEKYMPTEEYALLKPYLNNNPIIYLWDKGKYKLKK